MLWHREPYLDYLFGRDASRMMFVELFGPLLGLEDQWRQQGATEAELSLDAFDFDSVYRVPGGGKCGPILPPSKVIEETQDTRFLRDGFGRILQLDKRTATIPLPITFPVETFDDWLKFKPAFEFVPDRINDEQIERATEARRQGALIEISIPGGYDMLRELMGEMNASLAFFDMPELVHDINNTLRDTVTRVIETVSTHVTIDRVTVHEDFAGKSGPLLGPVQFDQFVAPYYRRVWNLASSQGASLFGIDSDDNVNAIIDSLMAAGINELFPNEPAAGMDIVKLREKYSQDLILRGGIDKHALRKTTDDILAELRRVITPATTQGGVVFGLDHRIPDGVSIDNYRYYVDTAREMLDLPPRDVNNPCPWQRTA